MAPAKIEEACNKAKAGHFQLACAAAWEGKHGCACDTGINHPNQVGAWWPVRWSVAFASRAGAGLARLEDGRRRRQFDYVARTAPPRCLLRLQKQPSWVLALRVLSTPPVEARQPSPIPCLL